jgi:solute carrier family 34 (sodium-dependent phosphate cotransporter)
VSANSRTQPAGRSLEAIGLELTVADRVEGADIDAVVSGRASKRSWRSSAPDRSVLLQTLALIGLLYIFFCSIGLLETGFKVAGRGAAETLIRSTVNPFVGLMVGILATSIIQSSSMTTSIVVGMVAAGALTVRNAVPFIIGANIGTTVTATLVAMGSITRREEFRRSFAAATVHDFFNLLSVVVLFPLELSFHGLERTATWIAGQLLGVEASTFKSPVKVILEPVTHGARTLVLDHLGLGSTAAAAVLCSVGLVVLFLALYGFSNIMRRVMARTSEAALRSFVGRNTYLGLLVGLVLTIMVQSSSITTSLMVPLAGTGVLTLTQIYPLTLGANLGTTVTALLAALTGNVAAITIALTHTCFNLAGILLFLPLPFMRWPIGLASRFAAMASRRRAMAIVFLVLVFFVVPASLVLVAR